MCPCDSLFVSLGIIMLIGGIVSMFLINTSKNGFEASVIILLGVVIAGIGLLLYTVGG